MPPKPPKTNTATVKMFQCPVLTGKSDFEPWWTLMDDLFYSANWQDFWSAGLTDPSSEEDIAADLDFNPNESRRQEAWGLLKSHMQPAERKKFTSVAKGHVEGILRKLRHTYLKKNEITLDKLRRELSSAQLEDHADLSAYITHVEWVCNRMAEQGESQSTGNRRYTLLKGLPADYAPAVQSLKLPQQQDLTWDEIVAYLENFVDANPTVLGAGPAGPASTTAESTHAATTAESAHPATSQEVCRNFSMTGACLNGDGCGYRHVHQPNGKGGRGASGRPVCAHCKKTGHLEEACFSKHGRPDWHKEKYPSWPAKSKRAQGSAPDIKATIYAVLSELRQGGSEPESKAEHFAFNMEVISAAACAAEPQAGGATMLDGGSTRHVTYDPADCVDIEACDIKVKVGGGVLTCLQQGTRVYRYLRDGQPAVCYLRQTLIIPGFGLKIVAEAPFLLKGCSISKHQGMATISTAAGTKVIDCPLDSRGLAHLPPSYAVKEAEKAAFKDLKGSKDAPNKSPVPSYATLGAESSLYKFDSRIQHSQEAQPEPLLCDPGACIEPEPELALLARAFSESHALYLWHCRLGHRNFSDVAKFLRRAGIPFKLPASPPWCAACVEGKSTRYPLGRKLPQLPAPRPGYLLHSDCAGPFPVTTRSGKRYFKVLVDDFSRRIFVSLLKSLSEAFDILKGEVLSMEADFGHDRVVAQFHADGATYFEKSAQMKAYLLQKGIAALYSPPDTQELNGVAERTIRTLMEMALCMLRHAGAPSFLWGEAVLYAAFILNRLPFRNGETATRLDRWLQSAAPPALRLASAIHTWGCAAWVHVHSKFRGKLEPKADKFILLGWDERRCAYRLGALQTYRIKFSAHVTFHEDDLPCRSTLARPPAVATSPFETLTFPEQRLTAGAAADHGRPRRGWTPSSKQLLNIAAPVEAPYPAWTPERLESDPRSPVFGRKARALANYEAWYKLPLGSATLEQVAASSAGIHGWANTDLSSDQDGTAYAIVESSALADSPPICVQDECIVDELSAAATTDDRAPRSYRDAIASDDSALWVKAVLSELASHAKNGTFGKPITKEQLRQKGFRSVPLGDVFKIKRCGRFKYRLVVRGFLLRAGIEFNETFAPVAYITTLRLLLALATKFDWEIKQGDVGTAFLCSDMDTEVYVTMPAAVLAHSEAAAAAAAKGMTVYRLLKGVPGIPQGSRLFNMKSHAAITAAGFTRSQVDHALYVAPNHLYLVVWVDDLFFFFPTDQAATAARMWAKLQGDLDLGEWLDVDDCLGCNIRRHRASRTMTLTQTASIKELIAKAGLSNANAVDTPCATGFVFTKADCPQTEEDKLARTAEQKWFRSALMSCMYYSSWSKPDITFTISKLAKFMHNPGDKHKAALKRLIRYVGATSSRGLTYSFAGPPAKAGIYGYYDAAFADDVDTRRSTMGYVFFYEGCAISWHSKLHTYVTTSSNHSEYCAGAKAAREAKMLKMMMTELGFGSDVSPIDLFSDSQGATAMSYNPVNRNSSKHIDLADHYVREQVERGAITISYVSTKDMVADALTKSLPRDQFKKLMDQVMGPLPNWATA